jgi:hypothetical protein
MVMMNDDDDDDDDGCHDDDDDIDVYSINPSIKPRIAVTVTSKCYDY